MLAIAGVRALEHQHATRPLASCSLHFICISIDHDDIGSAADGLSYTHAMASPRELVDHWLSSIRRDQDWLLAFRMNSRGGNGFAR